MEYMTRLAKVQEKVKNKIFIIPRVYTSKPRTLCNGYLGMLYQPDIKNGIDIYEGVIAVRKLHLNILKETGLTTADEMLYPEEFSYISDFVSYVTIGARSVENQLHRLMASGLGVPVGFKNPICGNFRTMRNSISAAQEGHTFLYRGWEVASRGNPFAYAILRGYTNHVDEIKPNYSYDNLERLSYLYHERNLKNMAVIIDTNHANSGNRPLEQIRISKEILRTLIYSDELKRMVKGLMIESYLEDGNQSLLGVFYGKSVTDPCLRWEKTEKLIYEIADGL